MVNSLPKPSLVHEYNYSGKIRFNAHNEVIGQNYDRNELNINVENFQNKKIHVTIYLLLLI